MFFPDTEFSTRLSFRAKNYFSFEVGNYRVFTADSAVEVYQALQLRGQVFLSTEEHIDIDHFDKIADHILIEDKQSRRVIGTYRLISDIFSGEFYSSTEFNIDVFLQQKGVKVELGRACIHPDFRNGRSIDLLWRGISTYLRLINGKYLFGCSSVFLNTEAALSVISAIFRMQTENAYQITSYNPYLVPMQSQTQESAALPGLLQSYINAGAIICGQPYWDETWNCVDFFTLLDINRLSEKYKKHYFSKSLSYVESI